MYGERFRVWVLPLPSPGPRCLAVPPGASGGNIVSITLQGSWLAAGSAGASGFASGHFRLILLPLAGRKTCEPSIPYWDGWGWRAWLPRAAMMPFLEDCNLEGERGKCSAWLCPLPALQVPGSALLRGLRSCCLSWWRGKRGERTHWLLNHLAQYGARVASTSPLVTEPHLDARHAGKCRPCLGGPFPAVSGHQPSHPSPPCHHHPHVTSNTTAILAAALPYVLWGPGGAGGQWLRGQEVGTGGTSSGAASQQQGGVSSP